MKATFTVRRLLTSFVLFFCIFSGNVMAKNEQLLAGAIDKSTDQHFLEDFYKNDSNTETGDHEVIELAFTVPNDTDGKSTTDFYKEAVEQLKKKNSKLQKLRLRGGVLYRPKDSKSSDELNGEITHIIDELKTLDSVVNASGVRLRRLICTAVLGFEKNSDVNITEMLKAAYGDEVQQHGDNQWNAMFKVEHGRGLLKIVILKDEQIDSRPEGRSRYFPVSPLHGRMGPGPMLGSASYDPEKNVTRIWSAKSGHIEIDGNHMDSEELDEYLPRNFDNE
ncbi:hypothetical protein M3Y96_01228300 [Aphelenchoides besseyi]|nr:hypothetical protein M3Y96_01228300 [Aphelenchoides besseyi]